MADITQTTPAYNPADANTLDGVNNLLQEKIFLHMQKVLPGIVQSYDRMTNRAIIRPAITGVASKGQKVPKETLFNIPVFCMSGGGIVMSFPVRVGDKGWLVACDRDISIFKQNLEESSPNTYRKHEYQDAFFLPDKINEISVGEDDEGALVISTIGGITKFSLKEGEVKITGNTIIEGSLTVSGEVTGVGIPLSTHVHGGIEPGTGTTEVPQ